MWIWVAIKSESKKILGISLSKERNMLIAEHSISSLTKKGYGGGDGKHSIISTDGGTWYPKACQLVLKARSSPYPFFILKKYHRKNNTVYLG